MEALQKAKKTFPEGEELAQQLMVEARSQRRPETGKKAPSELCLCPWLTAEALRLLRWVLDRDKHLVIALVRFDFIAQILAVISASTSIRMSWSTLYNDLRLMVGERMGFGVNYGASTQSNNFFVQCRLQDEKCCHLERIMQHTHW